MQNPEDKAQIRIDHTTDDTYKALSASQKRRVRNQIRFLKCYSETRSKSVSARYAGVNYRTMMKWISVNSYGFADRIEEADIQFCENLEQLALERVKLQDAKSNPVLLITLLNANLPNKYRPTVVVSDDTAKNVLSELRKLAKDTPVSANDSTESSDKTPIEQVQDILEEKKGGMS